MDTSIFTSPDSQFLGFIYSPVDIIFNTVLAFLLGVLISFIYKKTHKGLSYSQSFMLTMVFLTVIVSIVMMIIGNNVARAFALVGALSIIRFRTVVKDTKDTAYIFMALCAGMASGTSSYFLGIFGTAFFSLIAVSLDYFNYGSFYKSEFILIFRSLKSKDNDYSECINQFSKSANLIHLEQSGDDESIKLNFDIILKNKVDPEQFIRELSKINSISEVVLVASKHDVDY
ncbi:DUF4956 domain-containing protein [Gammaproteobacteria bacterium]|jgi:uncharacterized membrane protein YhiD involved in acid resistance|nr:DUF4956 domain-containing protein [Gammaproteobacteria bacterium]